MKKTAIKTLIHAALTAEAKPIIGYFRLACINKIPFNIYANDNIALVVSGIGAQKTKKALAFAFTLFSPRRAINIGMAGCIDKNIKTGSLFCATHENLSIPYASLSSHEKGVESGIGINSLLADMEGEAFLNAVPQSMEKYIFKVVSDHLDTTVPTKAKTSALIQKTLASWSVYV
ncbi:MAG: nucleoside phosphorylase [Campylobacteraceae bacterium]|jgi:hypothetical protein|nr:nucleoside phosphorylase [Campylobacteraceae bacterium]